MVLGLGQGEQLLNGSISGGITSPLVTGGNATRAATLRSSFSLRTAYLHAPDITQLISRIVVAS